MLVREVGVSVHRASPMPLLSGFLLSAILVVGTRSTTHQLNVRTGDGRIHTVSFGELPASADVDASRFCAKHGVLDDECSKLASSMKSVQAKNRGDQWGMSISSPPEGAQVRVPGDLDVVLEFFFENKETDPAENMYVCLNRTSTAPISGKETSERTCWDTATRTGLSTFFPPKLVGYHLGNFELMQWGREESLAHALVSFTTVCNDSDTAVFFDAYCNMPQEGSVPDPMSRRPMAFLNNELMFRSTGTSNPGRNFPGIWLPSAGIAPLWFMDVTSPLMSFRDINHRQVTRTGSVLHKDVTVASEENPAIRKQLQKKALTVYPMIDKRFQLGKTHFFCTQGDSTLAEKYHVVLNETVCKEAIEWEEAKQNFSTAWTRQGLVDVQQAQRAGSHLKVHDRRYVLDRFYSIRTMAVSIRLHPSAWRANGYWGAACQILSVAAAMGIDTLPVVRKRTAKSFHGICEVNQFVHAELGFPIEGWEDFYKSACSPLMGEGHR